MLQYFIQLNDAEKKSVLQLIKTFLNTTKGPVEYINIEQYNQELAEAEAEFQNGEFITHEEMLNQMKQWQKKNTRLSGRNVRKRK
jgi:predicted transcriptional regulator